MRKWFWGCTAAGVVAAGLFGMVRYCSTYPDSPVTRAVASACEMGLRATPFTGLHVTPAGTDDGSAVSVLADPVPCQAGAAPQVAQIELPGNKLELPAPIVIREDEELTEPQIGLKEPNEGENLAVGNSTVVEWQALPIETLAPRPRMPLCDEEDQQIAVMSYAAEDCPLSGFWQYLTEGMKCGTDLTAIETKKVEVVEDCQQGDNAASLGLWRLLVRAITGEDAVIGGTEESEPKEQVEPKEEEYREEPRYYHDHELGCTRYNYPYSGQHYSPLPIQVEPTKIEPKKTAPNNNGSVEESEPTKTGTFRDHLGPRSSLNDLHESRKPRQTTPRIDTMEFRPSDHRLNEYDQGPGTL